MTSTRRQLMIYADGPSMREPNKSILESIPQNISQMELFVGFLLKKKFLKRLTFHQMILSSVE